MNKFQRKVIKIVKDKRQLRLMPKKFRNDFRTKRIVARAVIREEVKNPIRTFETANNKKSVLNKVWKSAYQYI